MGEPVSGFLRIFFGHELAVLCCAVERTFFVVDVRTRVHPHQALRLRVGDLLRCRSRVLMRFVRRRRAGRLRFRRIRGGLGEKAGAGNGKR